MEKTQSWYSGQWGNTWNSEWTPPWQAVCGVLHSSVAPVYWGFGWRMRPLALSHQTGVVTALLQFWWCWHPCPKWRGLCCLDSPIPVLRSAYVVAHRRPLDTSWTIRRLLPILSIVVNLSQIGGNNLPIWGTAILHTYWWALTTVPRSCCLIAGSTATPDAMTMCPRNSTRSLQKVHLGAAALAQPVATFGVHLLFRYWRWSSNVFPTTMTSSR